MIGNMIGNMICPECENDTVNGYCLHCDEHIKSEPEKIILDACCGGRMMWFNKHHPNALYIDNRIAEKGHIQGGFNPNNEVKPDTIMDFRELTFPNKTFRLVVFDPPHMKTLTETSIMRKKFGCLNDQTWKADLRKGFSECWRVLMDYGVLVFKWAEDEIKLKEVLELAPAEPLFGHTTGSKSKTHWLCFMKIPSGAV
jgi:hypothetical protein